MASKQLTSSKQARALLSRRRRPTPRWHSCWRRPPRTRCARNAPRGSRRRYARTELLRYTDNKENKKVRVKQTAREGYAALTAARAHAPPSPARRAHNSEIRRSAPLMHGAGGPARARHRARHVARSTHARTTRTTRIDRSPGPGGGAGGPHLGGGLRPGLPGGSDACLFFFWESESSAANESFDFHSSSCRFLFHHQ